MSQINNINNIVTKRGLCESYHSLQKHMVKKHFRFLTNMLKIRSRGFDRAQYCNVNQI